MADITITTIDNGTDEFAAGFRSLVWVSATVGYHFSEQAATEDFIYRKTTDGGATWGSPVVIHADTNFNKFSVWADWWTPGITGDLIHIVTSRNTVGLSYLNLDVSTDTLSTPVVVQAYTDVATGSSPQEAVVDIVKSRGGNLYVAGATTDSGGNNMNFERSTDGGATWAARTTPWEATAIDRIILQPGNEADNQDIWAIFWDVSADELDLKVYDDSGNTWATTNITTSVAEQTSFDYRFAASCRHSDNHTIVVIINGGNAATTDMLAFDITNAAGIAALTNVFTDEDTHLGAALAIDQTTDDLYAFYLGDPAETAFTAINAYYKKSTDGGTTWGAKVLYNEGAAGAFREIYCDPSVGPVRNGLIAACWLDQDPSPDTIDINITNAITVTGTTNQVARISVAKSA